MEHTSQHITRLIENIERVIHGKLPQIKLVLTALFAEGHILMEDNPGTGKTVLARTLAQSIGGGETQGFKRIQFTPDLLPMDLVGMHIYNEVNKEFIFKPGPVFTHILLADEINRASPKVQSALLECMAEHQVTVGDTTYSLAKPFFTIATQNPIEMDGTYPLPAAQLDRFFIKIIFGYVDETAELEIFRNYLTINQNLQNIEAVLSPADIVSIQESASKVFVHDEIIKTVRNMVAQTRKQADILLGASTRSGIAFIRCLKAHALLEGRDFVNEQDIWQLAVPVLDHRLVYRSKEAKAVALENIIHAEMDRLHKSKI